MKETIDTIEELNEFLEGIEMRDTRFAAWDFSWKIGEIEDSWTIQCSFERPDANTGEDGKGYGRKWLIEPGANRTGVMFTAWRAVEFIIIHELHESFTVMVNGERVRVMDPHKSVEDLAVGSRRA